MSEYIKKSDAIKAIQKRIDSPHMQNALQQGACLSVLRAIETAPTIEPKRGKWLPHKQDNGKTILWKCSECGRVIYSETETDRLEFNKWCSRCGADMRGDDNE